MKINKSKRFPSLTYKNMAFISFVVFFCMSGVFGDDNKIKDALIQQSLSSYKGNCPCPEFRDRAGKGVESVVHIRNREESPLYAIAQI